MCQNGQYHVIAISPPISRSGLVVKFVLAMQVIAYCTSPVFDSRLRHIVFVFLTHVVECELNP